MWKAISLEGGKYSEILLRYGDMKHCHCVTGTIILFTTIAIQSVM